MFSYHSRRYGRFALCLVFVCLFLALCTAVVGAQSNVDDLAAEYGVTPAKTELIKQVLSADPSKRFEELVPLTVRELEAMLRDSGQQQNVPSKEDSSFVSEEAAKAAAFEHAGVSAADVTILSVKQDWDRRSLEWEIDFLCNGYKYEYDVDTVTGKVTDFSRKVDKNYQGGFGNFFAPKLDPSAYITEDQALSAALEHAGFAAKDVNLVYVKLDMDDGYPEFDVEFYTSDGMEYDYEIDANSGEVVSFDRELDYHGKLFNSGTKSSAAAPVSVAPPATEISEEEAKAIALQAVGVASADRMKAKKDFDDGMYKYEIEFVSGTTEYEVEVSVSNGTVLSVDRDSIFD